MKSRKEKLQAEANFFSKANNALTRSIAWGAIPYFQQQIHRASNLNDTVDKLLGGRKKVETLTLACGMMTGEYRYCKARGSTSIDAFDISEGQRDKFYKEVYDGE